MHDDRRAYVPGASFFFTLVTNDRARLFATEPGRAWRCGRFPDRATRR
jgi:hypothetical protein